MVGEFVFLTDMSNLCQWTNTFLVTAACIPLVLFALLQTLIPRRRNERFKLKWKEDYFERTSLGIAQAEDDFHNKKRVEDGEREAPVPGFEDGRQAHIKKQAI